MVDLVYTIFLYLYAMGMRLAAILSPKASKWIRGREGAFQELETKKLKGCAWFHAASLGEFEQVSQVISQLKKEKPNLKILVTFFSPSGYEARKYFGDADHIMYLPFDKKDEVRAFLNIVQPSVVIWVRYEFWLHMLEEIKMRNIPLLLLNGVFRSSISALYKPYLKRCLSCFSAIYVLSPSSQEILHAIGVNSLILSDTRYDRVAAIRDTFWEDEIIARFVSGQPTIVFGSTWPVDEEAILLMPMDAQKWIIVPHDVNEERILSVLKKFPKAVRYSDKSGLHQSNIMIIDTIGLLSRLYRYATVAYVGGGFDKVVHSLTEPLAYGIPIVIGPNISKSEEAINYVKDDIIIQIQSKQDLPIAIQNALQLAEDDTLKVKRLQYFAKHQGSTDIITSTILKIVEF